MSWETTFALIILLLSIPTPVRGVCESTGVFDPSPGKCNDRCNGELPCEYCEIASDESACEFCWAGYKCEGSVSHKTACPKGYYQPDEGQSTCLSCDAGTYQSVEGSASCTKCPVNHYCPAAAEDTTACSEGNQSPEGSDDISDCQFCVDPLYWNNGGTCTIKTVCNATKQYEDEVATASGTGDRVCVNLTPCPYVETSQDCSVGRSGKTRKCDVLVNYITGLQTLTSNRICATFVATQQCSSTEYMHRAPVHDSSGFLVKPADCRPLHQDKCITQQTYYIVNPLAEKDAFGNDITQQDDRPFVCKPVSECSDGEFEVQTPWPVPKWPGRDRVCRPHTQCNPFTQYLYRKGNSTHDNNCTAKTDCSVFSMSKYELVPAVDSPDDQTTGNDTQCANYTDCGPGSFIYSKGDILHDVVCKNCSAGTKWDGLYGCTPCVLGEGFAPDEKSTECLACGKCDNAHAQWLTIAPTLRCPANQTCTQGIGYNSTCTLTQNSTCMECPDSYKLGSQTGLCFPCKEGFFHNKTKESLSDCVECPEDHYCPGKDDYAICQDFSIFWRNGTYQRHPRSPIASVYASQCNCSIAGGFQAGVSMGPLGCRPCEDGTFSAPGSTTCETCPIGTFSKRESVRNYYKCPTETSPVVKFNDIDPWPPFGDLPEEDCNMTIGAWECTPCATAKPGYIHTKVSGATTSDQCTHCPINQWWNGTQCKKCKPACAIPFYEQTPCSDESDRVCLMCDTTAQDQCTTSEYMTDKCDPVTLRPCAPCNPKPANSYWVRNTYAARHPDECTWRCNPGFYTIIGTHECLPCDVFDGHTCPGGKIFRECTFEQNAACDVPCDESLRPKINAKWVLTRWNATLPNPRGPIKSTDLSIPNKGCLWECDDDLYPVYSASGIPYCLKKGSWDPEKPRLALR